MIKDDRQYDITKMWAEKFERGRLSLRANEEKKKKDPDGWQLIQDSYECQRNTLQAEMAEYEALVKHDPSKPLVIKNPENILEISDVLIKARIGLKITQKELAAICDRTEAEIASYEEKDYQNASFVDAIAVSTVLGIKLKEGVYVAEIDDFWGKCLEAVRKGDASEQEKEPMTA
ncbi:MAG: hypothetical protein F6J93_26740 [Oscillatoria sp. SIO1A7]|nr:hypothetical protein [Oscillatoria sp. SIO1A7]